MYRIALCDDEQEEINKTEELLAAYKKSHPEHHFTVWKFGAVEPLQLEIEQGKNYDILLLDIYLPGKNGIDGYRELQRKGLDCPVIFLTTSREHAVSAFEVNAVQYLVKPVDHTVFFSAMEKSFRQIEEAGRRHIVLRVGKVTQRITLCDILYCEAQQNYQLFRFLDGTELSVRITLTELYEKVSGFSDFVRVGNSYIINLAHVLSITAKEIRLEDGSMIWLPRGAYSALRASYFAFYCDGRGE